MPKEPTTYRAVTFKDRLMQALEQIRAVERKIEIRAEDCAYGEKEEKFHRQLLEELRDSQDTLLILQKEMLYYISQ